MTFDSLYEILHEMPQQVRVDLQMIDDVRHIKEHWENLGELNLNNTKYEIWSFDADSEDRDIVLIHNNSIDLESSFTLYGKGIIENYIQQKSGVRGLARAFYIEYLLNNYDFILSDTTMTKEGFDFWTKLYSSLYSRYHFRIYDTKTHAFSPVKDIQQLNDVFGPNANNHFFRFFIKKKRGGK